MIESEHSRKWQPSSMSGLPKKVIPREIVRIRLQRYFLLQARPASAGTGKTPECGSGVVLFLPRRLETKDKYPAESWLEPAFRRVNT